MKVRPSVKPMCDKCKVIKRKGVIRVICENCCALRRWHWAVHTAAAQRRAPENPAAPPG